MTATFSFQSCFLGSAPAGHSWLPDSGRSPLAGLGRDAPVADGTVRERLSPVRSGISIDATALHEVVVRRLQYANAEG